MVAPVVSDVAEHGAGRGAEGVDPKARGPQSPLTLEEIQGLTRGCSPQAPTGVRNRALIVVLSRVGLRLSEALNLSPERIDFVRYQIAVGGRHSRVLPLEEGPSGAIVRWINLRDKTGLANAEVLFCTLTGDPMDPAYVRQALHRLAEKGEVQKRVNAQGLRDAYAAELWVAGLPPAEIQYLLGFESRRSLARYLSPIVENLQLSGASSRRRSG